MPKRTTRQGSIAICIGSPFPLRSNIPVIAHGTLKKTKTAIPAQATNAATERELTSQFSPASAGPPPSPPNPWPCTCGWRLHRPTRTTVAQRLSGSLSPRSRNFDHEAHRTITSPTDSLALNKPCLKTSSMTTRENQPISSSYSRPALKEAAISSRLSGRLWSYPNFRSRTASPSAQ